MAASPTPAPHAPRVIEVEDLTYAYTGASSPAVASLSFTIERGEIFGFLGPSGAGKSTTQKILIRLLQAFQGRASALGRDLRSWGYDYYERIGVSPEVPNFYSKLTGIENLRYFGSLYAGPVLEIDTLLAHVGLENDGHRRVAQYSKGMRNRLNVARALLHAPEVLFLDEPTAGLDPVNARRIRALIRSQEEAGRTIFLTTHDMTVADELCDRVAFIVAGEIAVIDAPAALRRKYGRSDVRVEYTSGGQTRYDEFPLDGLADNDAFRNRLRASDVRSIHTQEATLEDVFIAVTGRSLQ
jgi:fluoroquinolone transport system ATP-binding protein